VLQGISAQCSTYFSKKDFFLVLDNAQSNNIVDHWEGLKFAFMAGASGSKAAEDLCFTLQCNDKHSKESSNARH
ncbi:hypothetical protein Goklo_002624, partial [Gossypium klotzschianum]|nr:hypothetical protein [Gossypium klotzschianum]